MALTALAQRLGVAAPLAVALLMGARRDTSSAARATGAQPDSAARVESAYAQAVLVLGDSALRQRDFFPARVQVRLETALLDPGEAPAVPFGALAERAAYAARAVTALRDQFGATAVPADLGVHHADVLGALRDEAGALGLLASAAAACEMSMRSELRCRTPLMDASIRLSRAARRYLDVRRRIHDQITDTGTELPDVVVAGR